MGRSLYTIGHSTRTLEFFVGLLAGYDVQRLVDVRTIPRSRHNPQFNKDTFSQNLKPAGIHYTHRPGLGGLRRPTKDSENKGWRNSSFRGYADYMATPEFEKNLEWLIETSEKEMLAVMCAEAVPWRCHRSLIADALTVRGIEVYDIQSRVSAVRHTLTPFAKVNGARITYPPVQGDLFSSTPAESAADRA